MPQKKAAKKGFSAAQKAIIRARSGAAISATEANRFKALAKGGKLVGKAAGAAGRRKLPRSLTSEKRGKMTKGGGMSLGRCP